MKKTIIKIVIFVAILGAIYGAKKYIDFRTFDYKPEIKEAITNYFVNDNRDGLDDILKILDENKNNDSKRTEVQNYSYSLVGSWFTYADQEYACDDTTFRTNKNSCLVQLEEFRKLYDKLVVLYNYKSSEGYTIILPSYYNSLVSQVQKRITDIEKKANSSRNPSTSEEQRIEKCNKATECDNCRDGICKCYYTSNGVREELSCQKSEEFIESLENK